MTIIKAVRKSQKQPTRNERKAFRRRKEERMSKTTSQKNQTNGRTTIRERLQKAIRQLVLLSIVPLVILSVILNLFSTLNKLEDDMLVIAELSADRIQQELKVSETIVSELGCSYQLSASVFTPAQKQEYINQRVEAYGMVRGKLISANGICAADGTDYNDREYFKRSMQAQTTNMNELTDAFRLRNDE